jgi:hypothetical protein
MALMRLVVALAVMLLAVLPHATLAASAFHAGKAAPLPSIAKPDGSHAMHGQATPTPCHESDDSTGKQSPTMPSCCILGCGLLAWPPALDGKSLPTRWRLLSPPPVLAMSEAAPEPAERPPRSRPDRRII